MAKPIEFNLFAPYNKGAALIGSFSDWQEIPMQKDDQGYFRTHVELDDGEQQYKFRVQSKSWFVEPGTWIDNVDPYATDIDNPTQNGVLRVKDGEKIVDTYVWQHDDQPLPADHELVIYEMHVADFSGGEDDPYPRAPFTPHHGPHARADATAVLTLCHHASIWLVRTVDQTTQQKL